MGFTYEKDDIAEKLETFEWDNTWIDHPGDSTKKRILYIGDSISCATRYVATCQSDGKMAFDGYGTSKGLDNPYFQDSLKLFASQEGYRDVIIFNNGLHGWHLDDETDYKTYYKKMVEFLLSEFKDIPLAIVLTTHIADDERVKRVLARNKVAVEIAKEYNLPVIDLYEESLCHKDLLSKDGVHFTPDGYVFLAKKIVASLNEFI